MDKYNYSNNLVPFLSVDHSIVSAMNSAKEAIDSKARIAFDNFMSDRLRMLYNWKLLHRFRN